MTEIDYRIALRSRPAASRDLLGSTRATELAGNGDALITGPANQPLTRVRLFDPCVLASDIITMVGLATPPESWPAR